MIRKALYAAGLLAFAISAQAATDYPTGYTKCAKDGATCTFTGTRSVAYGKAGTFVYATLTGPINCTASLFPATSVATPRYCSYGAAGSSSSSSSSGSRQYLLHLEFGRFHVVELELRWLQHRRARAARPEIPPE